MSIMNTAELIVSARTEAFEEAAAELEAYAIGKQRSAKETRENWCRGEMDADDRAANQQFARDEELTSRVFKSAAAIVRSLAKKCTS